MNRNWIDANEDKPIVRCLHCSQWAVVYTQCGHCGAPVEPDSYNEDHSPMIACEHCGQFGVNRTECQHCGAPMPDKIIRIIRDFDSPYWASPKMIAGGISLNGKWHTRAWTESEE